MPNRPIKPGEKGFTEQIRIVPRNFTYPEGIKLRHLIKKNNASIRERLLFLQVH
jgi:hypothetical protein